LAKTKRAGRQLTTVNAKWAELACLRGKGEKDPKKASLGDELTEGEDLIGKMRNPRRVGPAWPKTEEKNRKKAQAEKGRGVKKKKRAQVLWGKKRIGGKPKLQVTPFS